MLALAFAFPATGRTQGTGPTDTIALSQYSGTGTAGGFAGVDPTSTTVTNTISGLPDTNGTGGFNFQVAPDSSYLFRGTATLSGTYQFSGLSFQSNVALSRGGNNLNAPTSSGSADEKWTAQLSQAGVFALEMTINMYSTPVESSTFCGVTVIVTNNGQEVYHQSFFADTNPFLQFPPAIIVDQRIPLAAGSFSCEVTSYALNSGVHSADAGYSLVGQIGAQFPLASNDTYHPTGAGPFSLDVLANDSEAGGGTLTISNVKDGLYGTAQIVNNRIVYTPGPNYTGYDFFTYTVSDSQNNTDQATVTLSPYLPAAANATFHSPVAASMTLDVVPLGTASPGYSLSIASVGNGSHGTAKIVNNQIVYTPDATYRGSDSFPYSLSDSHGGVASATVTLRDFQPLAADHTFQVTGNGPFALDIVSYDIDPDLDPLTVTGVATGTAGTTQIVNNKIVYTPGSGFRGIDSFTYTISDGYGGASQGTITVSGPLPIAADATFHQPAAASMTFDVVPLGAASPGYSLIIASVGNGSHGTTQIVNNRIIYTPDATYRGNDSFVYSLSDGHGGTASGSVTLQDAQPVAPDHTFQVTGDGPFTLGIAPYDSDSDLDSITVANVANGTSGTTQIVNNKIVYTPGSGFQGSDSFSYAISDGYGGVGQGTITINRTSLTDTIILTQYNGTGNATGFAGGNPPSTTVTNTVSGLPDANGTGGFNFQVTPDSSYIFRGTATLSGAYQFSGLSFQSNVRLSRSGNSITNSSSDSSADEKWTAQLSQARVFSLQMSIGMSSTPVASSSYCGVTVVITNNGQEVYHQNFFQDTNPFAPIPPPPIVVDQQIPLAAGSFSCEVTSYATNGGQHSADTGYSLIGQIGAQFPTASNDTYHPAGAGPFSFDVLANDSEAGGAALTISKVTNGIYGTTQIVNNQIVYTPGPNYFGYDAFAYTVSDSQNNTDRATVLLKNTRPVAANQTFQVTGNGPFTLDIVSFDSDYDLDSITLTNVANGTSGTTQIVNNKVVYTPGSGFSGTDSFSYTISDGHGGSDTGTISLSRSSGWTQPRAANATFHLPTAASLTLDVVSLGTVAHGDSLSIVSTGSGSHGTTAVVNNQIVYTPDGTYRGNDFFNYSLSDGHGNIASGSVTLQNSLPVAGDITATYNSAPIVLNAVARCTDADQDSLTVHIVTNPTYGTAATDGTNITYTTANLPGFDRFTYSVSDGHGGVATASVTILDALPSTTPGLTANKLGLGNIVPGSDNAWFSSFGLPTIDASGNAAFVAETREGTAKTSVLFAKGGVQYSAGDAVSAQTPGARFKSFSDPSIDSSGHLAFLATLSGVPQSGNQALFAEEADGLHLVASTGTADSGTILPLTSIGAFIQTDSAVFFSGKSRLQQGAQAIYGRWNGDATSTLLLSTGQTLFGNKVTAFTPLTLPATASSPGQIAAGDDLLLQVSFKNHTQALVLFNNGSPASLVKSGDPASGIVGGGRYLTFGKPALSAGGAYAFRTKLAGPGLSAGNNVGIFSGNGLGQPVKLLQTFDPAPGLQGVYLADFKDPVINSDGSVAVVATLRGVHVTEANRSAILYIPAGGAPTIVARTGASPTGLPVGAQWQSFVSLALPDQLGPVFTANLKAGLGGVTPANAFGAWALDGNQGLDLIAWQGGTLAGQPNIRSLDFLTCAPKSPEQPRSFNAQKTLVYRAMLSGGIQQIFTISVP